MIIEIYKKDECGKGWTMCAEVYSKKDLKRYYKENSESHIVWKLKHKEVKDPWENAE